MHRYTVDQQAPPGLSLLQNDNDIALWHDFVTSLTGPDAGFMDWVQIHKWRLVLFNFPEE